MVKRPRARIFIPLAVLGLLLLSALAATGADNRPRGVAAAAVFDARGRLVGNVLQLNGGGGTSPVVMVKFGTTPVSLSVNRATFGESATTLLTPVIYESTNCSGQGFDGRGGMGLDPDALIPTVLLTQTKVFIPTGEPPRELTFRSIRLDTGECQSVDPAIGVGAPVVELGDLAEFQAPFSLRTLP
jgi:hypothetical protein